MCRGRGRIINGHIDAIAARKQERWPRADKGQGRRRAAPDFVPGRVTLSIVEIRRMINPLT